MTFDENLLLSLKRTYSKDEAFKFLLDELAKAKFKIGELQSENAELKDQVKKSSKPKTNAPLVWNRPKLTKEDLIEERFVELNKKLTTQGSVIKKLKGDVDVWRSKCLRLTATPFDINKL